MLWITQNEEIDPVLRFDGHPFPGPDVGLRELQTPLPVRTTTVTDHTELKGGGRINLGKSGERKDRLREEYG